jgi:predicted transcriptional regulator
MPVSLAEEMKAKAAEPERGDCRKAVREGLDDVDAGCTVSMDATNQWLDSLDTSSERRHPKQGLQG